MIDSLYRLLGRFGFTDPLHPPIVHIPIGLVIGAFVFLAVALLFKRGQLVATARHASILALVFAFPSILFGALDWIHFYHAAPIPAIRIKMVLAAALLVLLALGIILGGKGKSRNAALLVVYALSLLDVVALGYFGASLIYSRGQASSRPSAVSSAAPAAATPAGFEAGRSLFADNCQACHPGGGNSVYPKLPVVGSKRLASLADFEGFVRAPKMPDGRSGDMPPFGPEALSSAQVKDLYAYASVQFK
jgi:mono/diheme cytochrome c family protein